MYFFPPSVIICWPFTLVLICCIHPPPPRPRIAFFQAVYISPYFICISHAHTAYTHTRSCNIFFPRTLAHVYDGFHEPERFSLPHSSFLIDLSFRFMPNHVKSQSTSRQIMLFMPPFMHPFFPFFFCISPLNHPTPFFKKTCCVRVCGMRSGGGADRGFFFLYIGSYILRASGRLVVCVLALSGRPAHARLRFSSRIMEVAFAYTLGFKIRFIPGLSLARSTPLREAAVVAALWFSLCNPLSLSLVYVIMNV